MHNDRNTLHFNDLLSSYSFFPTIFKPTRIQNGKQSLLDNFYINNLSFHDKSGVIIDDLFDHFPVFISLIFKHAMEKQKVTRKVVFDKNKAPQLNQFLILKLHNFQNHTDANEACNELIQSYMEGIGKYSKIVKSSSRKTAVKPWITPALLCSINHKNKLYKKLLKCPNVKNANNYKQYINILTNLLRDAKRLFYEKSFEENKNDSRNTWKLLNEVINKRKIHINEPPSTFVDSDGKTYKNDEISEGLNDFFSSIGSHLEKTFLPQTAAPLTFYLNQFMIILIYT